MARKVAFDITPDDPSYSIKATLHAVNPPDLQKSLDWPASDDIAFFPGIRQQLPWPDAFNYWDGQRLIFLQPLPGLRQTTSLDGTWETAFTTSLSPAMPAPADMKFAQRGVPFAAYQCPVDKIDPRPHGMYLRRYTFDLPAQIAGRTFRVVVERVGSEGTLYVNGKAMGNIRGCNTPLVADITTRPNRARTSWWSCCATSSRSWTRRT